MKHILLLINICITTALLTACGGKSEPVLTKSDPVAGIYLGGKLPGISEEMMKDGDITPRDIAKKIKPIQPWQNRNKEADERLKTASIEIGRALDKPGSKIIDVLNGFVAQGKIAGYDFRVFRVELYDKSGYTQGMDLY